MDDISLTFENVACGIVALAALNLCMKAVSNVYKTFLRPAKNLKKYGKWAVVTGATGKPAENCFAPRLAFLTALSEIAQSEKLDCPAR
jgi:hypothetical protein